MSDLSDLQRLLAQLAPPVGFRLDDRTPRTLLDFLSSYVALLPYDAGEGADFTAWHRILFRDLTPGALAELAASPAMAAGELAPQQAFLLAVLKLLQTPQALLNHLPAAHRQLYYRQLLGLSEMPAQPSQVALSFQIVPGTPELLVPGATVFAAGQDAAGMPLHFALDRPVLANQGVWSDLRWCTRGRADQPARRHVAFDTRAKLPWPTQGARLFDASLGEEAGVAGCMAVSAALALPVGGTVGIDVKLESAAYLGAVLGARISAGDRWLPLVNKTPSNYRQNLSFELPADLGPTAPPHGMEGLPFDAPVLQLLSESGESLPPIAALSVNKKDVAFEPHAIAPFGFGAPPQAVTDDQLCLGFTGLRPGQTISLYWNLQGARPLTPRWEYLTQANSWASLDAHVQDDTQGLFRSGLWTAVLPMDASDAVSAMPTGRHWLRALVTDDGTASSDGVSGSPWLTGLCTSAMTGTLMDAAHIDEESLRQPLPPGAVRQPLEALPGLMRTLQPWPSFGGRPQESQDEFLERVARRLSHRQRALTWKDMAAILKADFGAVFGVATQGRERLATPPAQQEQRLIVIPVNHEKDNADALRPQLSASRLAEMAAYLQRLASPWQEILVSNPVYRDVRIDLDVTFQPGVNPDYAYRQLQLALDRHYMPWAFEAPTGAQLAGRLDYYDVVAQAQAQPGVVSVRQLHLDGAQQSVQALDDEVLVLVWPGAEHRND